MARMSSFSSTDALRSPPMLRNSKIGSDNRARFIAVTDDWPEVVPITDAEARVIESHFAEELDDLFGPLA